MNLRVLTSAASVVSALASSACCWLPLLLLGAGFSAVGIGVFLERFRPLFLVAAALLLGIGFYLNYFRKQRCDPDSACDTPSPKLRNTNRIMLWISTALVATFAFFPSYVGSLFGVDSISAASASADATSWTVGIEGMTCAGCETAIAHSLSAVPGVLQAEVNYDQANAVILVDGSAPPKRMALTAAVGTAGYAMTSLATESNATESNAAESTLSGQWVTELEDQDGSQIDVIMDLGTVDSRWVGEFDLPKYNVINFPVEVRSAANPVELYLTAIGMTFKGEIQDDGTLSGQGVFQGNEGEAIVFRHTGPTEFSEGFLELETAAAATVVELLSNDGAELRAQFNVDRQKTRLLMLLSPT